MDRRMRRIIKFKVPKEHYQADALIFWCFDNRFSKSDNSLLESLIMLRGFKEVDIVKVAGGAKGLTRKGPEQDYCFLQLDKSLKLHNPPEIIIMNHADCGDYGKTFSDETSLQAFFAGELELAKEAILGHLSSRNITLPIAIAKYLADFEGIIEIA